MRTRRTILVALALLAASANVFAEPVRIGLEFGRPTGVIVIRPEPFDFKVGYDFTGIGEGSDAGSFIHVSADYRILSSYHLIDFLSLFLGVGAYVQIYTGSAADNVNLGARIPVGVQAFLANGTVELFLEVVPTVSFVPSITAFDQFQGFVGFTVPAPKLR